MMDTRIIILILLILSSYTGMAQDKSSNKVVVSNGGMAVLTNEDKDVKSASVSNQGSGNSFYLESGFLAEKQLQDTGIRSDKDIKTRDFIIERSKDIKIIYTPAPEKD